MTSIVILVIFRRQYRLWTNEKGESRFADTTKPMSEIDGVLNSMELTYECLVPFDIKRSTRV